MNLKREIEIELRFEIAIGLGYQEKQSIQTKAWSHITTIFKFSFVHSHSINS